MKLEFFNLIAIITIVQGMLISGIFFFRRRGNTFSNRVFAIIIFIYLLNLSTSFARSKYHFTSFLDYHKIIYIVLQLSYLVAPLFYLFVKNLSNVSQKVPSRFTIHFIPFALISIYAFFEVASKEQFIIWQSDLYRFNMFAILVQLGVYIYLCYRTIRNTENSLKKPTKDLNLEWVKKMTVGYIVIWFAQLNTFAILLLFRKISWCAYTESVYNTIVFILINFIIIIGLINPKLLEFTLKKKRTRLSPKNIENYATKIATLLKDDKLYRNPELSLAQLSEILDVNTRYTSEIINTSFGKSFIDLINEHRINESIALIQSNTDNACSFKEICYDVGFNSRTAFNYAFKKYTGLSPSLFRKNIRKSFTDS